MNRLTANLYQLWLHFLRFGTSIDLDAAKRSGNANEKAWCVNRISQLDKQIDNLVLSNQVQRNADKAVMLVCAISAFPWEWL